MPNYSVRIVMLSCSTAHRQEERRVEIECRYSSTTADKKRKLTQLNILVQQLRTPQNSKPISIANGLRTPQNFKPISIANGLYKELP